MKVTPVQVVKNYTIELSAAELSALKAIVEYAMVSFPVWAPPQTWLELHRDLRHV